MLSCLTGASLILLLLYVFQERRQLAFCEISVIWMVASTLHGDYKHLFSTNWGMFVTVKNMESFWLHYFDTVMLIPLLAVWFLDLLAGARAWTARLALYLAWPGAYILNEWSMVWTGHVEWKRWNGFFCMLSHSALVILLTILFRWYRGLEIRRRGVMGDDAADPV